MCRIVSDCLGLSRGYMVRWPVVVACVCAVCGGGGFQPDRPSLSRCRRRAGGRQRSSSAPEFRLDRIGPGAGRHDVRGMPQRPRAQRQPLAAIASTSPRAGTARRHDREDDPQAARRSDAAAGQQAADDAALDAAGRRARGAGGRAGRGAGAGPAHVSAAQPRRVRAIGPAICSRSTSTPATTCRSTRRAPTSTTSPTRSCCRRR